MATKKKKKKKAAVELTLWDVILSYPDLFEPKPYKGKIYYRTDALMDLDHSQLKELRMAIKKVKVDTWGDDTSEWPEVAPLIKDGNEREDQTGYKDRKYITPSTQTPVPVVDLKGKTFNPQMVKGGMFANVAIRISAWEFDGDEGVSIYLQGIQIDTSKASLNFGGGKSVKQMFNKGDEEEDEDESDEDTDEDEEDSDLPRGKKGQKKKPVSRDEEDDEDSDDDEDEEDDEPHVRTKKKKKPVKPAYEDDEDEEDDE